MSRLDSSSQHLLTKMEDLQLLLVQRSTSSMVSRNAERAMKLKMVNPEPTTTRSSLSTSICPLKMARGVAINQPASQLEATVMYLPISTKMTLNLVPTSVTPSKGRQPTPSTPETTTRDASATRLAMERLIVHRILCWLVTRRTRRRRRVQRRERRVRRRGSRRKRADQKLHAIFVAKNLSRRIE